MPKRFLAIVAALLLWSSLACAQLDINAATAEQLDGLKGIGPVKARAIVDYRRKNGPFRSVDDLQKVPGLGPAIVAGFRRDVTVGVPGAAARSERRDAAPARPAIPAASAPPSMVVRPSTPASVAPAPARPAMPPRPARPAAVN